MKSTSWKDKAELVGLAAIFASLVFVGMEMRQAQRIAFAEQQGALISDRMTLNEAIAANAELILKVNAGADLNDIEIIKAERLLQSHWNVTFFGYRRWYFLDHPALEAPVRDFARFLYHNPGMRNLWIQYRENAKRENEMLGRANVDGGTAQVDRLLNQFLETLDRN